MSTAILEKINQEQMRQEGPPAFSIGDAVRVHVKIKEGDKERVQVFAGTVIARDGRGATETFTVRRVSYGEGLERVFPVHSPGLAKVEVERTGKVRRAKLYYLRKLTGKASKITEGAGPVAAKAAPASA
ncbi:MAG: 50S ribosomal protein L19 [Kiritimatiellaeota bacterium]|nr:50S ribosomal protein L19 [Kiritimatiellota bacterium]